MFWFGCYILDFKVREMKFSLPITIVIRPWRNFFYHRASDESVDDEEVVIKEKTLNYFHYFKNFRAGVLQNDKMFKNG